MMPECRNRLTALAVGGFQATARAAWRSAAVVIQYNIKTKSAIGATLFRIYGA